MKVISVAIIFAFLSLSASAADTTIVKLMQKVIEIKIPAAYCYLNILYKTTPANYDATFFEELKHNPKFSSMVLTDLAKAVQSDTSTLNWNDYQLSRARCIDKMHLPKQTSISTLLNNIIVIKFDKAIISSIVDSVKANNKDAIVVPVRSNARKKKIAKETYKATTLHDHEIENKPLEEQTYFTFGKPIFSFDKKYAFISISKGDGGSRCLLRNNNGIWELLYEITWVV
jgi:hypothetical protein